MSAEQAESSAQYPPGLSELRAEVERLRAEVDSLRQAQSDQAEAAEPQMAGQPAARLAGSAVVGSPVIAGQSNTAEAPTMLQATNPTTTLGLLNCARRQRHRPGPRVVRPAGRVPPRHRGHVPGHRLRVRQLTPAMLLAHLTR
jgi:hypothetical protein